MSIRTHFRHLAALTIMLCALIGSAIANDEPDTSTAATIKDDSTTKKASPQKPFSAVILIDVRSPITYGDDVVVSLWINPSENFSLKTVEMHPKGILEKLYGQGACLTSINEAIAGIPLLVTCRLSAASTGLSNWNTALLTSARQQFEINILIRKGAQEEDTITFYEFGAAEFVSPMFSVILGGVLGAGLWALFLPMSVPRPDIPVLELKSWKLLSAHAWESAPQLAIRWGLFLITLVQSTVLGGVTALVLIILARTSAGLDTPIALQVNDIWGGLLIGIFSTPLSKWIRSKVEKATQL